MGGYRGATRDSNGLRTLSQALRIGVLALAIASFAASPSAAGSTLLTWEADPTDTQTAGFKIYRASTAGGPYTQVIDLPAHERSVVTPELPGGLTYFVATAYNVLGQESAPSNEIVRTLAPDVAPAAPANVIVR